MDEELKVEVATSFYRGVKYVVLTVGDQQIVLRPVDAANVAKALTHAVAVTTVVERC